MIEKMLTIVSPLVRDTKHDHVLFVVYRDGVAVAPSSPGSLNNNENYERNGQTDGRTDGRTNTREKG